MNVNGRTNRKNTKNSRKGFEGNQKAVGTMTISRDRKLSIPKAVGIIMPDRYYTALRYEKIGSVSLAVAPTGAFRYRPTGAFDVDPLVASTAMAGFTELAALYGQYRVTVSKATLRVVNPNTLSPIVAILAPVNLDPGASPSAGYVNSLLENPYATHKLVGITGSPVKEMSCICSSERIFGSQEVYVDDGYASVVTSTPVNNWFWVIGFTTGNLVTNPLQWELTIDVGIEFFARTFLFQ